MRNLESLDTTPFMSYNGQGVFTNGFLQTAAGNYGSWNTNAFGAMQSSPFETEVEGSSGSSQK
jgi:hypothetical protein